MADWAPTAAYGMTGNGTNITPERWIKTYLAQLQNHDMWAQFVTYAAGPESFVEKGAGDTIRVNYFSQMDVPAASLTQGTLIARGTQTTVQASLTVVEEGNRLDISGMQAWCVDSPLVQTAVESCVANALQTNDARVGATFVGATSYFAITGTDSFNENADTGTEGTALFLPVHARKIVQRLRRIGIAPMADGYYHAVGQSGAWEAITAQSAYADNAARLGQGGPFNKGLVAEFGGLKFHDELGANASCTWSETVGTSVIFGADPVIGGNDINRPDLITFYPDPDSDAKRLSRVTWYNLQAYAVPLQGTTNARVFKLYHKC